MEGQYVQDSSSHFLSHGSLNVLSFKKTQLPQKCIFVLNLQRALFNFCEGKGRAEVLAETSRFKTLTIPT